MHDLIMFFSIQHTLKTVQPFSSTSKTAYSNAPAANSLQRIITNYPIILIITLNMLCIMQDDMPWIRRWWCHSMLANTTLAANINDTALASNVLPAEDPESNIQRMGDINPEESLEQSTMTKIHEAVRWVQDNMSVFRGHVELPGILSMTEEDRRQLFHNIDNNDMDDARECLLFVFDYQEDYAVFIDSCSYVSAKFNTPTLSP
ncbi:uncharacterized protein ACNS7B_000383 [Menidia menidia]